MFDVIDFAAKNNCAVTITPLFETEEYNGSTMRRLGGWHIRIDKVHKKTERMVDACFPFAVEEAIKSMIEEINNGGGENV